MTERCDVWPFFRQALYSLSHVPIIVILSTVCLRPLSLSRQSAKVDGIGVWLRMETQPDFIDLSVGAFSILV